MSEAKHTPGPWQVEQDRQHSQVFHVVGPSEIVMGLDGICSPHRLNDRTFQEDEANMRLIAAAPDLVQAAKCALGHLTGNMDGDMDLGDPIEMLRQAITKAEGRS